MLHIPPLQLPPFWPGKSNALTREGVRAEREEAAGGAVGRGWVQQAAHGSGAGVTAAQPRSHRSPAGPQTRRRGSSPVPSCRHTRGWVARELLGVEWGWSSTTILSPSPLSTAPSPDISVPDAAPGCVLAVFHRHLLRVPWGTHQGTLAQGAAAVRSAPLK